MTETLRNERYVIDGTLGEGSQATTLSAFDRLLGRYVAIKKFEVRGAKSWKDVELAEREARVLGVLAHEKLPKYIEHFEENGALYLVMEKIEGVTLRSIMKSNAVLSESEIERLFRDLTEICAYLHTRTPCVIHRDIKPGNVIRRPDGSFALVDFGAVRDRLRADGGSTVVGTFGYMAPEQFQGRASPASDWYAIGATCLAAWTKEEPETLPHRGLKIDVYACVGRNAGTPLARAIDALLEPDPDVRREPRLEHAGGASRRTGERTSSPASHPSHRPSRPSGREHITSRDWKRGSHPVPRWVRAMFWVAWAIAWPVIVETRALIVPWVLLPFIASSMARRFLRDASPGAQDSAGATEQASQSERPREPETSSRARVASAPPETSAPRPRVIDAELIDEEPSVSSRANRKRH